MKSILELDAQYKNIQSNPRANINRLRKAAIAHSKYIDNIHNNEQYLLDVEREHYNGDDYDDNRLSQRRRYLYTGKPEKTTSFNRIRKRAAIDDVIGMNKNTARMASANNRG